MAAPALTEKRPIEPGYCQCGCGGRTSPAPQTQVHRGWIKGQPVRFIVGHTGGNSRPIEDRFWGRVECEPMSGCWIWVGGRGTDGYGRIYYKGQHVLAHRVAWELVTGHPFPADRFACHKCDLPPCVNPAHIFSGTNAENMADAARKNRTRSGERNPRARLTTAQAMEVKVRAARGEPQRLIAAEFGVCQQLVSDIKRGIAWKRS